MTPVRLEPEALRSRVKHSTTEPLRSLFLSTCIYVSVHEILSLIACASTQISLRIFKLFGCSHTLQSMDVDKDKTKLKTTRWIRQHKRIKKAFAIRICINLMY